MPAVNFTYCCFKKNFLSLSRPTDKCPIFSYQKAAEMFAQTQNSFEEVALKFIRLQEKEALKTFLLKKLAGLRPQVI